MQVAQAIAAILKQEGVKFIVGYPVNPIIEAAAEATSEPSLSGRKESACTWQMQ